MHASTAIVMVAACVSLCLAPGFRSTARRVAVLTIWWPLRYVDWMRDGRNSSGHCNLRWKMCRRAILPHGKARKISPHVPSIIATASPRASWCIDFPCSPRLAVAWNCSSSSAMNSCSELRKSTGDVLRRLTPTGVCRRYLTMFSVARDHTCTCCGISDEAFTTAKPATSPPPRLSFVRRSDNTTLDESSCRVA